MAKKIKILFTISNFDTSGSGNSVYDLVRGLDKSIFEPEICCLHSNGELFRKIEALNVTIHIFPFNIDYRPFITFPVRLLKIYNFFKKNQYDIIHSWHWSSDFSEPLAAKLVGATFIFTKKAMGWGNKAWVWRSKLSSKIIAVNEDMITQFYENTSMIDKIVRIPLAVDVNYFKPVEKSYCSPEGLVLTESDFTIVSVANLVPVKGIEILFEAVTQLKDDSIKVLIVGDYENEYGNALKRTYKSNPNFMFLGKHLDVRPYLALADVFVIPTKDEGRKEGLPVAPMEAMASGRIVLGSQISGIKDVLKEFPECLFVPSDVDSLAKKIQFVQQMIPDERQTLANQMRDYVTRALSVTSFVEKHQELYINLCK